MSHPAASMTDYLRARYVIVASGCWEWTGIRDGDGYGRAKINRRLQQAHRVMLESLGRDIPPGMQVDHLCRNRACVNPDHLDVVTPRENTMRGTSFAVINAAKTHCPQGHEYTPENTEKQPAGRRNRKCRACRKARRAA